MAPLPQNNTVRAWIDYSTPGGDHSLMVRFQAGASVTVVQPIVQQLAQLLAPCWSNTVITQGFRFSSAGSDFSLPMGGSAVAGTAVAQVQPVDYPRFVSFVGRTSGGRRVRYYVYGCPIPEESDYRLEATDVAALDTVRAYLDDPNNFFVGIDGNATTLQPYINWGYNAYYQRKRRVTA